MTNGETRKRIYEDVKIGNLVSLAVDGKFFGRPDNKPERYVGYVSSLTHRTITLSTTHHENVSHGYVGGKEKQDRVTTELEIEQIRDYQILE